MKVIVVVLALVKLGVCKDNFTIDFIKSFIQGEEKPTQLIYNGLCWKKYFEVQMVNEVFKYGIRCSSSLVKKSEYHEHNLLFLVDLECPESRDVLLHATSQKLYKAPFRWLVLSSKDINPVNTILWSRPILTDSDLVLAENVGGKFFLTEIHRASINYSMQSTPRGYFNGSLVDSRPHKELFRRRGNLRGHPLVMANVIQESNDSKKHLLLEDRLDLRHDAATKLCWIAAKLAFEMLNATARHIFSYRWGYKVGGKWSGMIDDIRSNKADLGTNCVVFANRLEVVAYTDRVATLRMRFVFRQPPLTSVSNIFSLPFSTNVWAAIVVCVAASAVTLYFTSKWEASLETSPAQLDGSIGDALLLTVSAVAQQGCFIEPRRTPGRIMEWVLFTALMALYAAYSANIVVLLQAPSNSIRTLAHLADSKITLAALDVDYTKFVLNDSNDQTHITINKRMSPEFYNIYDGVEKIRQGMFAFHAVVEPIFRRIEETFLETEKCDLAVVDYVSGFDAFTPVKKDSPFLELIRVVYKQIRESGIQAALNKRMQVPMPRCSTKMSAFSSVGLLDLWPVIIFMLYGIALSTVILVAEIVCYKYLKTHRRRSLEKEKSAQQK